LHIIIIIIIIIIITAEVTHAKEILPSTARLAFSSCHTATSGHPTQPSKQHLISLLLSALPLPPQLP